MALWEVSRAFADRDIAVPVIPAGAGGAAMVALAYWSGVQATLAALVISVIVLIGWRLPGGATGYVRDVTASVFVLAYLPLLATFVALMLARPDGARRVVIFVALAVCSDVGGYFAGITLGQAPDGPADQPAQDLGGPGRLTAGRPDRRRNPPGHALARPLVAGRDARRSPRSPPRYSATSPSR